MNRDPEFTAECTRFLAVTAIKASKHMTISERIMLHHGIATIFPAGSQIQASAAAVTETLSSAECQQLELFKTLEA